MKLRKWLALKNSLTSNCFLLHWVLLSLENTMKQSKKPGKNMASANDAPVETGRGDINHNFLAALVTSQVYKQRVVKAKKGKGAYMRKDKHNNKGSEPYLIAA